jgi:ribose/xylose/arabinose/galactoside ABC-type transport system permease subunit
MEMTATINYEAEKSGKKSSVASLMVKYGLAFFALLCIAVFSIIEPKFLGIKNLFNIITAASTLGITAIGLCLIMSSGEIDFAVGMELTTGAIVIGTILDKKIVNNYALAFVLTIAVMAVFGLINAFLNIKIGIPAFIATMGTAFIATGFSFLATGGIWVNSLRWPKVFTLIGQGFVFNKIPIEAIFLVIITLIVWIYTEFTNNGKATYAVGSNINACNYIGINQRKEKLKNFVISAVLCGIAGIMLASEVNRMGAQMGEASLVNSLTAIMLGATFLRPGVFNIPGTILGTLIVSILNNGETMISAPTFSRDLILALVMIVSVSIVTILRRRTEKIE